MEQLSLFAEAKIVLREKVAPALPAPTVPAKKIETRDAIRMLVNKYSHRTDTKQEVVWNLLYYRFMYSSHIDIADRKRNPKNKGKSGLDLVFEAGKIEEFYALTVATLTR